jgi:sec-independent protein translocase protein TatB
MFDLDLSKMILVGIVALAVIPPKDLPRVMRTVGQTVGRMRRMAAEFQGQFMDAMREVEREADLDSVKKEFQAINDQAKIDTSFDPVGMVHDDMTKALDSPAGAAEAASSGKSEGGKSEGGKSEAGGSEAGKSEVGESEVALAGPEPAEAAAPAVTEAEPEAPAARRSAAE